VYCVHGVPNAIRESCGYVGRYAQGADFGRAQVPGAQATRHWGYRVAADAVGAGLGEVVLYATGSAARQTKLTDRRPCDGVIMAIVDTLEVDGVVKYDKAQAD
jgi:microcompartment protein CcmK/EutM